MRIITGKYRGRKIYPPTKMPYTRPTTDIAKEGLFNILSNNLHFEGLKTLDLFGGTGSISYELASRGAEDLTIVEKDVKMYEFIKSTSKALNIENFHVIKSDVFKFLNTCTEKYDFIFAGPPYALKTIDDLPKIILERELLTEDGLFALEHTPANNYEEMSNFASVKNYGTTLFSFFKNK
ncbi:MAG: RsmD family RNA methyltransferase [Ginsengibacter sp.]